MIIVSKLDKPKHLRQVIHKDFRGNLTEIFLKNKIKRELGVGIRSDLEC